MSRQAQLLLRHAWLEVGCSGIPHGPTDCDACHRGRITHVLPTGSLQTHCPHSSVSPPWHGRDRGKPGQTTGSRHGTRTHQAWGPVAESPCDMGQDSLAWQIHPLPCNIPQPFTGCNVSPCPFGRHAAGLGKRVPAPKYPQPVGHVPLHTKGLHRGSPCPCPSDGTGGFLPPNGAQPKEAQQHAGNSSPQSSNPDGLNQETGQTRALKANGQILETCKRLLGMCIPVITTKSTTQQSSSWASFPLLPPTVVGVNPSPRLSPATASPGTAHRLRRLPAGCSLLASFVGKSSEAVIQSAKNASDPACSFPWAEQRLQRRGGTDIPKRLHSSFIRLTTGLTLHEPITHKTKSRATPLQLCHGP